MAWYRMPYAVRLGSRVSACLVCRESCLVCADCRARGAGSELWGAAPVSHRRNHTPALLLVSHLYSTTCSTAWTRPRMHIRSRPAPGTGDESRDRAELHEELTLAHRRGTQDTHRTGAGRTHRGSTAVGAQRGAAMHLPEKIGWQSSGAQLYPRPCRASLGRDSSSVQPPRTNPALASVSGASRRSRAAPGRRSLIIAAIASAAMAIAVTPPLGTVLVAHAELAGTASPSASPLLPSQSASHPAAAMVAAERKKKSTPPALAGEAPASQLKSYSQPLPQRMGTTERATKCRWPTSAANSSNIAIHQMRTRHGGTRSSAQNERRTRAHDGDGILEHA